MAILTMIMPVKVTVNKDTHKMNNFLKFSIQKIFGYSW